MRREVLVATTNRGKRAELEALLAEVRGLVVVSRLELPPVVEDGETFEANARKKAVEISQALGVTTLADDSGLEVDALDGAPGVWSARYAGEGATDAANNEKLVRAMEDVPDAKRTARFRCVLVLVDPQGDLAAGVSVAHGVCEGRILRAPRGKQGFGYDPLFVPAGESRSFGEMSPEEKLLFSHRARAAASLRELLEPR